MTPREIRQRLYARRCEVVLAHRRGELPDDEAIGTLATLAAVMSWLPVRGAADLAIKMQAEVERLRYLRWERL